jgi:hypothetical protein
MYEIIVPTSKTRKEAYVVLQHSDNNTEDPIFAAGPHSEIFDIPAEKGPDDTVVIGYTPFLVQTNGI